MRGHLTCVCECKRPTQPGDIALHSHPMKTAQRILATSARLFNEQGERNVTASDIALELDISPGNLYYHFRGKDSIHSALFKAFYQQLAGMLAIPASEQHFLASNDPLERSWLFLTVVLETMLAHRYLYLNMSDLMLRYPDVDRGMRRLIGLKHDASRALAAELLATVDIQSDRQRLELVANNMAMTLLYWLSFNQFVTAKQNEQQVVHEGVLQILSHCAPYLGAEQAQFYRDCELINARLLDAHSA